MKIPDISTYKDGRMSIKNIYNCFFKLIKKGLVLDIIGYSKGFWKGKRVSLPIICLRTKKKGNAVWIISGIHGEEPAGPNAIANGIDYIAKLDKKIPVVLLPLCNPLGYLRDWRYVNQKRYSKKIQGHSVGDSEHYLLDKSLKKARNKKPSCSESKALTSFVLKLIKQYNPKMSFDFHEDDMIPKGYIYSQGKLGAEDKIAQKVVKILLKNKIPIKMTDDSRFGEKIIKGVISNSKDGSIDELIASEKIIKNNKIIKKPYAKTVIVVETPAAKMSLEKRKNAHLAILKNIKNFI